MGVAQLFMDLLEWISADLASIRSRFEHGIVAHVDTDRWKDHVGGEDRPASSLAFLLLHITYHHDLAIQTAVQNRAPLMVGHRLALGLSDLPAHCGLAEREDTRVTMALDVAALRTYAHAVWDATDDWLARVATMAFDSIPDASWRLEHLGGVTESNVPWLHAMWTGKTVGWFAQWEAVGHGYTHLGEMTAVRNQLGLSPF
jgi:hypothetical protein